MGLADVDAVVVTPFFFGAFLIPSNILIKSTFGGSSSILNSTNIRHSGHLNSLCVLTISSRHFRQKVCWQGRTLLDVSRRSRHTEHSKRSFNIHSSIFNVIYDVQRI